MSIAKAPELMTNDELAAEIERLVAELSAARQAAWAASDYGERVKTAAVRAAAQLAFTRMVEVAVPAILVALRTPAAAAGEGAVERVARAIEDALCEYIDYLRAPREHTAGMANQMVMNAARAALAAMPGAPGAAEAVCHKEQLQVWSEELINALAMGDHLREEMEYADAVDCHRTVQAEIKRIVSRAFDHPELAALSAAPPPAAESRAGEVEAENADGCQHCGSEFLGGDEENYPGWACGSYRMDNGQIVQEGDCERRELKRLRRRTAQEPAAGERGDG